MGARICLAASAVVKIRERKQCAPGSNAQRAVNTMWCAIRNPDYALLDGPLAEYLRVSASE